MPYPPKIASARQCPSSETSSLRFYVVLLVAGLLVLMLGLVPPASLFSSAPAGARGLKIATWNIAAVNNNPFEYWITHSDPAYQNLMVDVQSLIDKPGTSTVDQRCMDVQDYCHAFGVHCAPS